jgi:endonuclease III
MAAPRGARQRIAVVVERLAEEYPGTAQELCALDFSTPFQLLAATILSAQTTDLRVNMVTPALFARYPSPADLAGADLLEVEEIIHSTGFFRAKAKSLVGMARALVERFGGEVPTAMEDLVTVPGVGRKTANVVLSVAFDLPGLPVDTHVGRLTRLLGLTTATDPEVIEAEICKMAPPAEWGALSLRLILHGRAVCIARRPRCDECVLADVCPSAGLVAAPPKRARAPRAKK